jgi:hypothetical protein
VTAVGWAVVGPEGVVNVGLNDDEVIGEHAATSYDWMMVQQQCGYRLARVRIEVIEEGGDHG